MTSENESLSMNLIPSYYKTDANKKFLQATIDQLIRPGTVKKVNGYIGKQDSKTIKNTDAFLVADDSVRQNYQLEPAITIENASDEVTFYKDYIDYINQLKVFGANVGNHARLNSQESYSWNPHIDWDKIINFENYYWLPNGPDVVSLPANQQIGTTSAYKVNIKNNVYEFSTHTESNPVITLYKGQTYKFNIDSIGAPFSIKTARTDDINDRYLTGVDNQGVEKGIITFTVSTDAPSVLYYVNEYDITIGGVFNVKSIDSDVIDVDHDIVGKQCYSLSNGVALSNGLKIKFSGMVYPEIYNNREFYVEGVGTSIQFIDATTLVLIGSGNTTETIAYEQFGYDYRLYDEEYNISSIPDYITIKRGCIDQNLWSRSNRWFHKDIIMQSAEYNNSVGVVDNDFRAKRPIIEFEQNIKLYNHGSRILPDINLIDISTKDIFSRIEASIGYIVDGVNLVHGQKIIFTADSHHDVKNNIYEVQIYTINNTCRVHLELVHTPIENDFVFIKNGNINSGKTYWYNGSEWILAQSKIDVNQAPIFDVVDNNGIKFDDISYYYGSNFNGTKIFSYKVGDGASDVVLGFPLSYRNAYNIGDIVFENNLLNQEFTYKLNESIITKNINVGYVLKINKDYSYNYENGWKKCEILNIQPAIRIYKNSNKVNSFDIDIFDDINQLDDLSLDVFINGNRIDKEAYSVVDGEKYKIVIFNTDVLTTDIITIKATATQSINSNGFYEIPFNLHNNPLNEFVSYFSLGEIKNHLDSIINNLDDIGFIIPYNNNLKDMGDVTKYGNKFIHHSGPLSLAMYHITNENNNVIRAIDQSRNDYNLFKQSFILTADTIGEYKNVPDYVDLVLQQINENKSLNGKYYFSDMVAYGANNIITINIVDPNVKLYPLDSPFSLNELSFRSILVYKVINAVETQLIYGKDYNFDVSGFIQLICDLQSSDTFNIKVYDTTTGSFIPETPTKLGLWPKFEPVLYLDTSYVTPQYMIKCHDGSLVKAYGTDTIVDIRDELILELEKRIYNNIKVNYDSSLFDFYDIIPGYNRNTEYSYEEFTHILSASFYKWAFNIGEDYTKQMSLDYSNPFTYNYRDYKLLDDTKSMGFWRGIYQYLFDTDTPNLTPWEMLGFKIKPIWWDDTYGLAPYTSDNLILWDDLAKGIIRYPNNIIRNDKCIRPILLTNLPVDNQGNLLDPLNAGFVKSYGNVQHKNSYVFGDMSPMETAWRKSSHYPFSILLSSVLMKPAKTIGLLLDKSRINHNLSGHYIYTPTQLPIRLQDIILSNNYYESSGKQTAGLINYIVNYVTTTNSENYNNYKTDLETLNVKLSYRVGAFTSNDKFKVILNSKTPYTSGSVFVPTEDYKIFLNSSSAIKSLSYSGVIITKLDFGFEVKGYNKLNPYFSYFPYIDAGYTINVGGISESYTDWTSNSYYIAGKNVKFNKRFYKVKVSHTSTTVFDENKFMLLSSLPITGGATAIIHKNFNKNKCTSIPYGYTFENIQQVVDFLLGYGEWLKEEGFEFEEYNKTLGCISNWETSAKEFLFWTTQNWSSSEDIWTDWKPGKSVSFGDIVRCNADYFRCIRTNSDVIFNEDNYVKLDNLSMVGSSVISLSPAAFKLSFNANKSMVDDINNSFNMYGMYQVDGTPISNTLLKSYRNGNKVEYSTVGDVGIYGATFYLIQKEHVIIFNNVTLFNDILYNSANGFRQDVFNITGYVTTNWNGTLNIPGFIYNSAIIDDWQAWTDYSRGSTVKYKESYYVSESYIPGTLLFEPTYWRLLENRPTPLLLPNWTSKVNQISDFYNLDSDNFDSAQQSVAQHLIGYQKRWYLSNIIRDDVAEFKFYQGMIRDKGTKTVFNRLFDVLSALNKESIDFYEEWAVQVGKYGASSSYSTIEIPILESEIIDNPQGYELVNSKNNNYVDFIVRKSPNDIYIKPASYTPDIFPVNNQSLSMLRSCGYIRTDQVKAMVTNYRDLYNLDISEFVDGDYIWVGFEKNEWNIYRFTAKSYKVLSVDITTTGFSVTINKLVDLKVGDLVGINNAEIYSGIYKVLSVNVNTFTIVSEKRFTEGTTISNCSIFTLVSSRLPTIDDFNIWKRDYVGPKEKIWTDDIGNNKWGVWEYNKVYTGSPVLTTRYKNEFGKKVVVNNSATICAVSNQNNKIEFFLKKTSNSWKSIDSITNNISTEYIIAFDKDDSWFAIGNYLENLGVKLSYINLKKIVY